MPVANQISKFASAPKPRAAFTNFSVTILSVHLICCSMIFSLISRPDSLRIFSTILSMKTWMMTPIILTPLYLLFTPTIQPISLTISKMMFVQLQFQRTSMRHKDWSRTQGCGLHPLHQGTSWISSRDPGSHPDKPGLSTQPGTGHWPRRQKAIETPAFRAATL